MLPEGRTGVKVTGPETTWEVLGFLSTQQAWNLRRGQAVETWEPESGGAGGLTEGPAKTLEPRRVYIPGGTAQRHI